MPVIRCGPGAITPPRAVASSREPMRAQRQKLQHVMDHLIDSLAEGVIEKDQFTAQMNRTKTRIADIDAKIAAHTTDQDRQAHLRSVRSRLAEMSSHVKTRLSDADWTTKQELSVPLFSGSRLGQRKSQLSFVYRPTLAHEPSIQ